MICCGTVEGSRGTLRVDTGDSQRPCDDERIAAISSRHCLQQELFQHDQVESSEAGNGSRK